LYQEEKRIVGDIVKKRVEVGKITDRAAAIPRSLICIKEMPVCLCALTGSKGDPKFSALLREQLMSVFESEGNADGSNELSIIVYFGLNGLLAAFRNSYLRRKEIPLEESLRLIEARISHGISL
jgi:hypothetical protein